ncbi:MAG: ferrous iron transport protein A [Ruminococcaceae bacterium]|nr:ferrous iron transport protein A [Oscillospiraceae bacterium]
MILSDTLPYKHYIVNKVTHKDNELRRILDMGIISGTKIVKLFSSPFGDPTAYEIKNSVIALRKTDSDKIFVEDAGDNIGPQP